MIVRVQFKDPDGVYESIREAVESSLQKIEELDEDERETLMVTRIEKLGDLLDKWITYCEYLTVEFNTDAMTAKVVEAKGLVLALDYLRWQKFLVKDMSKAPTVPHFVVMTFETQEYTTPGYDRYDAPDRHSYEEVRYYAFLVRKDWEQMIDQIYSVEPGKTTNDDRKRYSFFKSMGRVEPKIDVKVPVSV